jgi:ABC-type sugar transport system permease subunit
MLFTFFKEVPKEILEAGRMDGARTGGEFWHLLLPLTCRASPPPGCCPRSSAGTRRSGA